MFLTDSGGGAIHRTAVPYAARLFVCIQDVVLDGSGLRIASSNGLKAGPWFGVRTLLEDFSTTDHLDCAASSAQWLGDGVVRSAPLGGSGCLGDFDVRFGGKDTGQRDVKGRRIWEWSTDRTVIPGSRTLTGEDIVVTNGVFEFRSMVVRSDEHVRFAGKNYPRFVVSGDVRIDGVLNNAGADQIKPRSPTPRRPPFAGQDGMPGGAGAGAGGRGGDSPHKTGGGKIHGSDGEPATAAKGHPLAAELPMTPGKGSQANPPSGKDQDVVFSAYLSSISQQGAAGGGGGALAAAGEGGKCIDNQTGFRSHPPVAKDFGAPSAGGKKVSISELFTRSEESSLLYLLGAAGGGGGGAHPHGAFNERPKPVAWSPAGGGAGGGGPLHLRAGGNVALLGEIFVNGGFGVDYDYDTRDFWNPAPGGAGGGGTVLVQLGGTLTLFGPIDALGGAGGRLRSDPNFDLRLDSLSGRGGDGYIRFERNPPIPVTHLRTLRPPATPANTGPLRKVDKDFVTLAASKFYVTGFLPSVFHYYEIRARIARRASSSATT